MALDRFAAGDRVQMAEWVTSAHLRTLGISDKFWVDKFLHQELIVIYPEDGIWRLCGRVVQVSPLSPRLPLNIKCCYLRRVNERPVP